jgi:hypothetical protein
MPKQATHLPVVRQWCQSLGILSAVSISRQEAEMKLAAYVPLLMDRFPDGAFTTASLEHCAARAVKGFPTYGELAAWLAEWWREHRPPLPALPPPEIPPPRSEPTDEERAYVRRCVETILGNMRSPYAERDAPAPPKPRYLSPAQLDEINPLPGGQRRAPANDTAPPRPPAA